MEYPWAVVGAQVICIKSTPWAPPYWKPPEGGFPKFMQQYTIRELSTLRSGLPGIRLISIKGTFACRAFRPLEKLTDETTTEIKETIE